MRCFQDSGTAPFSLSPPYLVPSFATPMLPQGSFVSSILRHPCTSVPGSGSSQLECQQRSRWVLSLASPLLPASAAQCGDCGHSLWARSAGPRLFWVWISKLMWGKQRISGSPGTSFIKPALNESVKEEGKLSCSVFISLKPHIKPLQLAAC